MALSTARSGLERRSAHPVLTYANLRKSFGDLVAVDDVSFAIDTGETYGLLGPNGAGKTTVISIVAGVLGADAGDVSVDERPMHSWGSPVAAGLLMLAFAVTAGGAGMLMGALAGSTEQAIAIGLLLALGMGALGGSMLPLEFFSPTMLTVAHLTPHAWAADGFAELVRHGGGVGDILVELGVLSGYALLLFAVASWGLRRNIARV